MKKINITRISVMLSVILLSICIYVSQTTRTNTNRNIGDAVQVTALPVSGKTVILDAGHGTPDEGASSKNKFKNNIKIAKTTRAIWVYSNINKVR